jgi:sulfhydrogenase subunit gamma (sulfur reductase)
VTEEHAATAEERLTGSQANAQENIYLPHLMVIKEITQETPDVKSMKLVFKDEEMQKNFSFRTGQFGEFTVFGVGESTFNICSSQTWKDHIECCFRKVGLVTKALWEMNEGDIIGFRGPYGNWYPVERMEGKNILFIAGGIALPPVRCMIWHALDMRDKFKDITILYGARTVADLVFKRELEEWEKRDDVTIVTTVDPGGETPDWKGKVGLVPIVLKGMDPSASNTIALVCGPPIMIKFTLPVLYDLGFAKEDILTSLENRMKCGLGKCGRCNVANVYICKDGPIFTAAHVELLPEEY